MPKYHRIQIDDRAYKALIAESIRRDGVDIRDIASEILIGGVSKEALSYSGQFAATFDEIQAEPSALGPGVAPGTTSIARKIIIKKALPSPPTGKKRGGPRKTISNELRSQVLKLKQDNPKLSNREIAREVGLSPAMINKILVVKEE